jgi:predicted negative regulator of RcsB-dependent stress response
LAAKRLTRKEIVRQDVIQQTLTETSSWLVRNLSYIFAIVAIVLVTILAGYLWRTYQQSVEAELQTKFSDALAKYHASVTEEEDIQSPDQASPEASQAPSPKYEFATAGERSEQALSAFRELSEEYSGMRLGVLSSYYVGLTLVDQNELEEAKTVLSSLVAESEFADISNLARNVLVQVAVSEGDDEEAIRLLREILEKPSPNFPQQMILMRLAQNQEATGDYEAALGNYKRISAEYAGSSFATKAQARIDYLEIRGVSVEEENPAEEVEALETPE